MSTIEWKNKRSKGVYSIGTQKVGKQNVEWFITKKVGMSSYQLHLLEVKVVPMVTRACIEDCQTYAAEYFGGGS